MKITGKDLNFTNMEIKNCCNTYCSLIYDLTRFMNQGCSYYTETYLDSRIYDLGEEFSLELIQLVEQYQRDLLPEVYTKGALYDLGDNLIKSIKVVLPNFYKSDLGRKITHRKS